MLKRLSLFLVILLLVFCPAFADMTDKATLGGIDSSGEYHYRVDSSGHLIPGTTAQNNLGDSTHKYNDYYGAGNLYFKSSLQAAGIGTGGATTLPTTASSTPNLKAYGVARVFICTRTLTLADGYPGQILCLIAEPTSDTGTTTITASRKTSWTSAAMDTVGDTLTLLYVDDTTGWIVVGANSVTVTS